MKQGKSENKIEHEINQLKICSHRSVHWICQKYLNTNEDENWNIFDITLDKPQFRNKSFYLPNHKTK